jgi:hypothetical protein
MSALKMRDAFAIRGERNEAVKILARSIFRELRQNGYTPPQIVGISSELIGLITAEIRPGHANDVEPPQRPIDTMRAA